ncbi:cell division protein FtsZ [Limnohabitans sp. Bal53]|uniref:cell division protein FtsZ n=1 Tax=Limnohabitans sp. Bal53 TaxID=1977910 RepID=UPI000D378ADE|nr:cell division protein FtsZ [Limnohabitans sp. Bal53]PUE41905.1 cell division protein FtsZ [Limnohabitans sp. Bal53]
MSPLQLSLAAIGALTVGAVVVYNYWTARKNAPRQADPHREPMRESVSHAIEPVLDVDAAVPGQSDQAREPVLKDTFTHLSQPDRKTQLDALIDVLAAIEVDQPVSGDAALAALPTTRRVGTKLFSVEGFEQATSQWEALVPGHRYSAFHAGVQLANRVGALNNIEFSEFVVKTQAFADAVGGGVSFSDMLEEVARARELDQFASVHDAQLSFTLCARSAAWSPGYIHQHAARLGFVPGAIPGRMVLPAAVQGLPPVLSLTFDTHAAMAEDPELSAIRSFALSLDVPQTARQEQPYVRLREAAVALAAQMDGVVTDGEGQVLGEATLDQIGLDLQQLYDALDARELSAGSPQARRLFS